MTRDLRGKTLAKMLMAGSKGTLHKHIGLFGVFALSFGTTVSSGFFLLPSMAYDMAGPAIVLAYLLAGVVVLLPILCKAELTTAMPRAGGVYFYMDRAFGPMAGSIAGISSWIALSLKASFALVGAGFYISLFFDHPPNTTVIAVVATVLFGLLNIVGAGKAARIQQGLVVCVIGLLVWFCINGLPEVNQARFDHFFAKGEGTMISMIGVVVVAYMGLTKVASVAEEVQNPERNIPVGMLLALGAAMTLYGLGVTVMIGVLSPTELVESSTPAAAAAQVLAGRTGLILVSIAAIGSFMSVANAGILSASRYPFAMGRDHTFPAYFRAVGRFNTPTRAVIATVALIVAEIVLLDPLVIAKYAGTLKLLLFTAVCAGVIVMRQSRIESYDPGFRAPLYPLLPIAGMAACLFCIIMLGWIPVLFALSLITVGVLWFHWYASKRVRRIGAIHHIFAQLGKQQFNPLDMELREIIKEKGLRKADPFEAVVAEAHVIDLPPDSGFATAASLASAAISERRGLDSNWLCTEFLEGTRIGATPVAGGAALPHTRSDDIATPELVIVRCREGMNIEVGGADHVVRTQHVDAIFFLVSPEADPGMHLRLLASIAIAVEQPGFHDRWRSVTGSESLKACLLRRERSLDLRLRTGGPAHDWIDIALRDLTLPEDVIVAMIGRDEDSIVPRGSTVLRHGDRVVLLGEPEGIAALRASLDLDRTIPLGPDQS
ncbi:MAG: amino acid permease [Phycisphaerales bacterium]|nr:amino acid permease [Phycisphaerales bacterium]